MDDHYLILLLVGLTVILAVVLIAAIERLFSQVLKTNLVKQRGQEQNEQPAWRRYHVHYYIYALLFLAFDMEMAYMYPWAVVFLEFGLEAFADMGIFLTVLFMGLLYAWSKKGLERQ